MGQIGWIWRAMRAVGLDTDYREPGLLDEAVFGYIRDRTKSHLAVYPLDSGLFDVRFWGPSRAWTYEEDFGLTQSDVQVWVRDCAARLGVM